MPKDNYNFKKLENKRITLIGMSGVGKTYLSKIINTDNSWFHFSADYRIGTQYLEKDIINNISLKMQENKTLKNLLKNNSINIKPNTTFDNLEPISNFLGKIGNPEKDGLPLDEFIKRQKLHLKAEKMAMQEVPDFINSSLSKGFKHFINDTSGSICEIADENIYKIIAKHTQIIYIKASSSYKNKLIKRARNKFKPLYYEKKFLQNAIKSYLKEKKFVYIAQINPDDFLYWVFPKLIESRMPKYQYIADKYGCTISSDEIYKCKNAKEIINLLEQHIK